MIIIRIDVLFSTVCDITHNGYVNIVKKMVAKISWRDYHYFCDVDEENICKIRNMNSLSLIYDYYVDIYDSY